MSDIGLLIVTLPPDASGRVDLTYRPPGLTVGLAGAGVGLALALLLAVMGWRTRRRRRDDDGHVTSLSDHDAAEVTDQ